MGGEGLTYTKEGYGVEEKEIIIKDQDVQTTLVRLLTETVFLLNVHLLIVTEIQYENCII